MFTLTAPFSLEEEAKKSRFIAKANHVETPEQAHAFLKEIYLADASHHCWAYRIGNLYRFSDDGEPSGSAGQPILAAIEGQNIDQVMVIVIRYFGGTKLGVGGLVRAYSSATANCLRQADKQKILHFVPIEFEAPFSFTGDLFNILSQFHIIDKAENYTSAGIFFSAKILEEQADEFVVRIKDASKGKVEIKKIL